MEYNVYCDESCHLQNDGNDVMTIGSVWAPKDKRRMICEEIKRIKRQNGLPVPYELKWSKVSSAKRGEYIDLINLFFDDSNCHFRGVVVNGKSKLDFSRFSGDYNDWYYKIYYSMLKEIPTAGAQLNVYMDIKQENSASNMGLLKKYLTFHLGEKSINNFQVIRSDEVEIMQMTDVLIGAISYVNRGLNTSKTKIELIDLICERSGSSLCFNTRRDEKKFSLLSWRPR